MSLLSLHLPPGRSVRPLLEPRRARLGRARVRLVLGRRDGRGHLRWSARVHSRLARTSESYASSWLASSDEDGTSGVFGADGVWNSFTWPTCASLACRGSARAAAPMRRTNGAGLKPFSSRRYSSWTKSGRPHQRPGCAERWRTLASGYARRERGALRREPNLRAVSGARAGSSARTRALRQAISMRLRSHSAKRRRRREPVAAASSSTI